MHIPARALGGFDLVGVGECCVDEVWRVDGAVVSGGKLRGRVERRGGGQVATMLAAAARLGLRAAFAGAVGDDEDGRTALASLVDDGVDVAAALRVAGARTRRALVVVAPDGERTVIEQVDARVSRADAASLVSVARVVHLDATSLSTSLAAARAARAAGALVSLDLDGIPGTDLDELLALTDLCVYSAGAVPPSTAALVGLQSRLAADAVCGYTAGVAGAGLLDSDGARCDRPAFAVEVVDTTACGDTFRAGLVWALLGAGDDLPGALRAASAAAALKCRDVGRAGCPSRAELETFLRQRKNE